jgi:deoxyadenosine/deoxycytidine kinase
MKTPTPFLVLDGVVGCGKTTLAEILKDELNLILYPELGNEDTITLLNRFYADKTKWSFTTQIHFLNLRFGQIKEIQKASRPSLLDRSIYGDNIFAEMLAEDYETGGFGMSWEEYRTYSKLLSSMLEHAEKPTLLVYLQCDVKTAVERINKRNRGLESKENPLYWERLNEKYEDWFQHYDESAKLLINVSQLDYQSNQNDRNYIVNLIRKELQMAYDEYGDSNRLSF